jgi:hypothetical protein
MQNSAIFLHFNRRYYPLISLFAAFVSTFVNSQIASALIFDGGLAPIKTGITTSLGTLKLQSLAATIVGIITIGQIIAIVVVAIMMIWIFVGIASKPSQLNDIRQVVTELWIPITVLIVAGVIDTLLNLLVNFGGQGAPAA